MLIGASGFWLPTAAGGAPIGTPTSIVNSQHTSGSSTTQTSSIAADIATGQLAVIAVAFSANNSVTVSSIDVGGYGFTKAGEATNGGLPNVAIFYFIAPGAIATSTTITVTFSGAHGGANIGIMGLQCSGIIASPLDVQVAATTASGSSVTAATGSLAQANELLVGAAAIFNGTSLTYSGASGFTTLINSLATNIRIGLDYKIVAATSSVNYTPTFSSSDKVSGLITSFKGN